MSIESSNVVNWWFLRIKCSVLWWSSQNCIIKTPTELFWKWNKKFHQNRFLRGQKLLIWLLAKLLFAANLKADYFVNHCIVHYIILLTSIYYTYFPVLSPVWPPVLFSAYFPINWSLSATRQASHLNLFSNPLKVELPKTTQKELFRPIHACSWK